MERNPGRAGGEGSFDFKGTRVDSGRVQPRREPGQPLRVHPAESAGVTA
jgi:hypothetical protein